MSWLKFLFWNAAGGIAWATAVALIAYYLGHAVITEIERYGLYAAAAVAVIGALAFIVIRRTRTRLESRL
jgi:membrane protein DedA with SNARE-associated domain